MLQESSWHKEDHSVEGVGGGEQISSSISSNLSLIRIGKIVCGRFDTTVGSIQPKSDSVIFVGFRSGNGNAHIYFVDDWWGEPDPGEADITQHETTLKWAMTHVPRRAYIDTNAEMKPGEPDVNENFLASLRLGCAAIAHAFGELDENNANNALMRLNALLSVK
ncbi:hypothetical protein DIE06_32030 [Burkholderia sp. Bp8998]|nr:hypothetical protein DIE06_32030 [Burkholderia sp. Bp8998]